uniref:Uncharacterized protein n=1 Tax=Octopus bimaculoides TaxID=37653 RepID=A0A0L8G4K8_OCTBM
MAYKQSSISRSQTTVEKRPLKRLLERNLGMGNSRGTSVMTSIYSTQEIHRNLPKCKALFEKEFHIHPSAISISSNFLILLFPVSSNFFPLDKLM